MTTNPNIVRTNRNMKKTTLVLLAFLFIGNATGIIAQTELRTLKQHAFRRGEFLKFRIHYGFIDAGEATLEVKPETEKFGPRNTFHIIGQGRTTGAFDWFFKVRDRYETFIDEDACQPWLFIRRVKEGGFTLNENYSFNPYQNTATSDKGTYTVPEGVQDLVSAYYYARCLDFSSLKEGDIFPINVFIDNEVWSMNIKFEAREELETKLGTFKCLRFKPQVQEGRIFKEKEGMTLWITDDDNRIPVRLQAEILVGSIKVDLSEYSGVINIISKTE